MALEASARKLEIFAAILSIYSALRDSIAKNPVPEATQAACVRVLVDYELPKDHQMRELSFPVRKIFRLRREQMLRVQPGQRHKARLIRLHLPTSCNQP